MFDSVPMNEPPLLRGGGIFGHAGGLEASADLAECRRLLIGGSRSFLAASRLLPGEVSQAACALYAFCRVADDRIDLDTTGGGLAELNERLDRIYAGRPRPVAADRAFAAVAARYRLPRAWPQALLEGFEWDARSRHYEDISELRAYAARVAGSVGAMMAGVMGVQAREVLARACELGVAMQLTNIARDVGEDARMGRLYLPRAWMREAGVDPDAWLAQPAFTPALGSVVRRLLDEAQRRYEGGCAGVHLLPRACRPGILAAARLYAEIGTVVRRRGFDSVAARAVVGGRRKAQLAAGAVLGGVLLRSSADCAPPPEIDFLVDAAGLPSSPRDASSIEFVLTLFERLERRDRAMAASIVPRVLPAARA